jgi:5S rRNA maturation endonuclease (ribonuclease M5)
MNEQLEICIPRVSASIPRKQISNLFIQLNIGYIGRIIENPLRSDPKYKRVIIQVKWDNNKELAKKIQETLQENKHMNIVYDMPWFWKIYANRR